MSKRILAIGLELPTAEVTIAACQCCGHSFEWFRGNPMGKAVSDFCDDCSLNRCDAYPGTCPNEGDYQMAIAYGNIMPINLFSLVE